MKCCISALILLVVASSAVADIDDSQPNVRAWREGLAKIASHEKYSLMVDVNLSAPPKLLPETRVGLTGLRTLAERLSRILTLPKGAVVLSRDPTPWLTRRRQATDLLAWIGGMSGDDLKRLMAGKLSTADVSPTMRQELVTMLATDPATQDVYLQRADRVGLRLSLGVSVEATDPATGRQTTFSAPLPSGSIATTSQGGMIVSGSRPDMPGGIQPPPASEPRGNPIEPTPVPPKGPLDFGKGRMLKLTELLDAASHAFHVRYAYDRRLEDSSIFVAGTFSKEAFAAGLRSLTQIPGSAPIEDEALSMQAKIKDLLKDALQDLMTKNRLPDGLTADDLNNHRQMSMEDLSRMFPGAESLFSMNGLGPGSTIRLMPSLVLSGSCGNAFELETRTRADGGTTTYYRGTYSEITIR